MNLVTRCAAPVQYYDAVKRYLDKEYTLVVDILNVKIPQNGQHYHQTLHLSRIISEGISSLQFLIVMTFQNNGLLNNVG